MVPQRYLSDFTARQLHGIGGTCGDAVGADLPEVIIQADKIERFFRQAITGGHQLFAVVAHQVLPLGIIGRRSDGFGIVATGDIRDEVEMNGGIHADTLHLGQLLRGGIEDTDKGAELFNEAVSQDIGIPPGHRIKQQELQHIVGREAIQTLREIALPQAIPMTGMFIGHALPSPFDKILFLSYHSRRKK